MICGWCHELLRTTRQKFCGRKCRQSAFRLRRRRDEASLAAGALIFGYADPPYIGLSAKYYRDEPSFAGEVDHPALIASLEASGYAGWALSCSARSLRLLLPLCPEGARVCPWVKPIGVPPATYGMHNSWEALIVVGGRRLRPGKRDWLRAQPARGGGALPGRKPIAFCAWLFDMLGMLPGDTLVDLFPGTGVVSRAWEEICRSSTSDTSRRSSRNDALPPGVDDASARAANDAPPRGVDDASSAAAADVGNDASRPGSGDVSSEYSGVVEDLGDVVPAGERQPRVAAG